MRPTCDRVRLFGAEIDPLSMPEAVARVMDCVDRPQGECRYVVTPNVDHVLQLQRNESLRQAYADAELVLADGAPVVLASRLVRRPVPERVAGADLVPALFDAADPTRPLRVYLLGAGPGIAARAAQAIEARWPAVQVVGAEGPVVPWPMLDDDAAVLRPINAAKPDVLVVGLGAPKQELWTHARRHEIHAKVALCVGGTINFLAGDKPRAPRWMRRSGFEWLHRLATEPRRLCRRYAAGAWIFPQLVWREWRDGGVEPAAEQDPTESNGADASGPFATPARPHQAERTPLSVVVPCYNEAPAVEQLAQSLARVDDSLRERYAVEFLLVDDASTDGTRRLLQERFAERENYRIVAHASNRGPAAAIMTGIRAAKTEAVCSIDADCSYDPEQLHNLLPLLEEDVDLVTASPYHPRGQVLNVPSWRLGVSRSASFLYRRIVHQKLYTYTSCFRVYRRSAVVDIELENGGFVGVAELLWRLDAQGSRIVECPAVLGARSRGQSKMRLMSVTLDHLKLLRRAAFGRRGNLEKGARLDPSNRIPLEPRKEETPS